MRSGPLSVDSEGRQLPEDENVAEPAENAEPEGAAPNPNAAAESTPDAPAEDTPAEESVAAESTPDAAEDTPAEESVAEGASVESADEEVAVPVSSPPRSHDSAGDDDDEVVEPIEYFADEETAEESVKDWYILKVAVNRETTVSDALRRRVKMEGLEDYVDEIVVPTEEVTEFTKTGKKRKVKKKLFPGYIVVHMAINDATWFLVRETSGIGDFTGAAGKPTPLPSHEVDRLLARTKDDGKEEPPQINISFKVGDRVRINEGNFQSFEGEVASVDPNSGDVSVEIVIFNRTTPVDFKHWQLEAI